MALRGRSFVLAALALVLATDGLWRMAVDSCQQKPYAEAADRLQQLIRLHPAPVYARRLYADMSWDFIQHERSLASVEWVWGQTRDVWLRTGRDQDRSRAAWLAVMLQHAALGPQ